MPICSLLQSGKCGFAPTRWRERYEEKLLRLFPVLEPEDRETFSPLPLSLLDLPREPILLPMVAIDIAAEGCRGSDCPMIPPWEATSEPVFVEEIAESSAEPVSLPLWRTLDLDVVGLLALIFLAPLLGSLAIGLIR